MATQAFYRKWRSQTFAELVGQEHVTRTLLNAVRSGRVAHAYVFSGPRGVGKTSAARLLAKAVNCEAHVDGEPCNQCSSCRSIAQGRAIDVIEIDAASNNGVEQIRDLTDKVSFMPSESRFKFYILDEAHMLSGSAANAFLKTLEEPPAHTVFVLATTESYRLPATILSRCQRLEFRRVSTPAMLKRLRQICEGEGIDVEPAALELIARGATGSLRDAQGLLDQLVAYAGSQIGVEQVRAVLGLGGGQAVGQLVEHMIEGDLAGGLRLINELVDSGADPRHFGREVVDYLRGMMLLKAGESLVELVDATTEVRARMKTLADRLTAQQVVRWVRIFAEGEPPARGMSLGQIPLELAFVEAVLARGGATIEDSATAPRAGVPGAQPAPPGRRAPEHRRREEVGAPPRATHVPAADGGSIPAEPVLAGPPSDVEAAAGPAVAPAFPGQPAGHAPGRGDVGPPSDDAGLRWSDVVAKWPEVVARIGADARTKSIQALLRDARPLGLEGGALVLGCRFPFHRDRLSEDKTRAVLERALNHVLGRRCRVRPVVDDGEEPRQSELPSDPLQAVMDDPIVKGAVSLGWRVKRIVKHEEVVYDAESQNDPAAPGQDRQDAGGAGQ